MCYNDHVIPRDLYVRLLMKRETATPTGTPTAIRVLTATPSSSLSPAANLIGRSGGGKGNKQKVLMATVSGGVFTWLQCRLKFHHLLKD